MRITEVETIAFNIPAERTPTRWGYSVWGGPPHETTMRILRLGTDEGAEGFSVGGYGAYFPAPPQSVVDSLLKPLLLGEDPLDRERLWQWMTAHHGITEQMTGSVDMALWDLLGRMSNLPVYKLLGGYRDRVKAYCSTAPNLGGPEVYAQHALEARERGYTAFKVHAYIYWNPHTRQPAPAKPAFPDEDLEVCRAVRDAVGDDMVLMHDPWGVYTLQESIHVGRELEKLGYYWLEQPMEELRLEAYVELCRALDIAILAPELEDGGPYTRASWIRSGAADMGRMDVGLGGITATMKTVHLYEAFGQQCEIHVGGFGNLAALGATSEETCEYYERGLTLPGVDRDATPPYLHSPCDPMDDEGYVHIPQGPGLGIELNWDYIDANRVEG
jgi:L-alanine-DL-glutamate epimerase-like enolase superfamily enzyme